MRGLTPLAQWELAQSSAEAGRTRAVFELRDSDATRSVWPHAFRLQYIVSLSEESLDTRLRCVESGELRHASACVTADGCLPSASVANTGDAPFEFQALLHTYHRTAAIESAGVSGLKGCTFVDKLRDLASERGS